MSETSEPAAVAVDALSDLPLAWLYRLSTNLDATSAARLRSACKLLQKVIDATWEPDEPTPPHRRGVPLTFEQVQASPHKPWKAKWLRAAEVIAARRAAGLPDKEEPKMMKQSATVMARQTPGSFLAELAGAKAAFAAAQQGVGSVGAGSSSGTADTPAHTGTSAEELLMDYWTPEIKSSSDEITFSDVKNAGAPSGPSARGAAAQSYEEGSDSDDEDARINQRYNMYYVPPEPHDGCDVYWQHLFGPALTRLTANQACNLIKGKPVLGFIEPNFSKLSKSSTAGERMHEVVELTTNFTCGGLPVVWPPPSSSTEPEAGAEAEAAGESGSEREGESQSEDGSESGSEGVASDQQQPGRGNAGWGDHPWGNQDWDRDDWDEHHLEGYSGVCCFRGEYSTPGPLRAQFANRWQKKLHMEPHQFNVTAAYSELLAMTDSSCRGATADEVQQFVKSDAAADANRFDIYLSKHSRSGPEDVYVFLGPVEPRFTGRLKAAPQLPAATAETVAEA